MKNNASLIYSVALLVGDFVALLAAFTIAYILRVSLDHTPISASVHADTYINIVATLLPFFLLIFALFGLYDPRVQWQRFREFGQLALGCLIGIMAVISYSYLFNVQIFPARLVTLYGFLLAFCFVLLFRTAARGIRRILFRYNVGVARVLLVGDTRLSLELVSILADTAATGYRVVGIVGCQKFPLSHKGHIHCFESFAEATGKLDSGFDTIVQTELYATGNRNEEILVYAQEHHLDYRFVPGNSELFVGNIEAELFQSVPVISVNQTALTGWGRVVKRLTDIILSSVAIVITSPIMVVVAAMIKLYDRMPLPVQRAKMMREQLGKKFIAGEVAKIEETKLTIKRIDGETQVIEVDENTSFRNSKRESITLADVKVGDRVAGRGDLKDGIFVAGSLNVGAPGEMRMRPYNREDNSTNPAPPPQNPQ